MMAKTTHLSDFGIDETYLAHTPKESLIEHSNLTLEYLQKILKSKNIETILDNLFKKIDSENLELLKEIFVNTIYLHDIGKTNPYFQAKKMGNEHFKKYQQDTNSSDHSALSSNLFIEHYLKTINEIKDKTIKEKFKFFLYAFSYHQAKHHGNLASFEEYKKDKKESKFYWDYLDRFQIPHFEFYILNKLLFSLLISSDYYATTEYMATLKIEDFGLFTACDKERLKIKFDDFRSQFTNQKGINALRDEMFREAECNLLQNLDKNIFYLEAPTGSGKTITSINLALNLLKENDSLNKLFYIFPFNTLVEQTKNVFDEIFKDGLKIEVINSITPITINKEKQEDEESKYQKSYINRLFFHSPAIITTHVSLFNILFGTSKEDNFPLWQLANSVIILDEIQNYNNHLWWYMVEFFDKYASLLNIKIIVMSATLPKLDYLLGEGKKDSFVELIANKEYFFQNELFKNRVRIDFSLIDFDEKMNIEKLAKILYSQPKDKKILFEFIKKQSAREFYNAIKDKFDNVYELSGDDNKAYRQHIINKSKSEMLIIVATQVIEAGVDIDMDIGFKDISTIDSEEQFMGRINRSCQHEGRVYFFNMDDARKIYRGDNRLGLDLTQEKYRDILKNKKFDIYYKEVLDSIKQQGDRFQNGTMTNYENFAELVKKLNYKEISKTMTLINSQNFTLYFPFQIDLSIYKGIKEFIDLDEVFLTNGKLDGQKVWDEFKLISTIKEFPRREHQKSILNTLMQFFTFSLIKFNEKHTLPYFDYEFGGYFFIQNYEEFITSEGKFDRIKYLAKKDEIFL